VEGAKAAR